jgi:hypothetical protein
MYQIIILIITPPDKLIQHENYKIWESAIKYFKLKKPEIRCFFVELNEHISKTILVANTIYCPGVESITPGTLKKTVNSFKYCLDNFSFTYIFRTNLSNIIHAQNLLNYTDRLPLNRCISSISIYSYAIPHRFPSNDGYIISRDLVEEFITNTLNYRFTDDVSLGSFLNKNRIPIIIGRRLDLQNVKILTTKRIDQLRNLVLEHYHYKCNLDDGEKEATLMAYLLELQKKEKYIILS